MKLNPLTLFANPLFSGGFLLMMSGGVMALCRHIPSQIWQWFKRQFVVEVAVTSDDPIFEWISIWLHEHPYSKKTRTLIASSLSREYDKDDGFNRDATIIFSPSHGNHFFIYKHKMIWLSRNKESSGGQSNTLSFEQKLKRVETYNIRVLGRKQDVIRSLIDDARKTAKAVTDSKLNVYLTGLYGWNRLHSMVPRPLRTIVLPKGQVQHVVKDMRKFLNRAEWYHNKGIPYHRGYLFYGLAGTGKTSLITALAGELHMSLYVMTISGNGMTDDALADSMRQIPQKSIILFEDIDAAAHVRTEEKDKEDDSAKSKGITLSGLLNCLDGVMAKNGCIIIMTTNHINKLDPALIRPGRVDYKLEFKEANRYQLEYLYDTFSVDSDVIDKEGKEEFVSTMLANKATTATAQEALMQKFG